MVRLLALVACGTRTVIDATFGTDRVDETRYAHDLLAAEVRVINAEVTLTTSAGRRSEVYWLITMVLDPDCSASEIVGLYHQRWEIETSFLELKSTTLSGRLLRARTPVGCSRRSTRC